MLQHSATAMSATYEQQGDDTQALAYFRIAQQYKDSLAFHEQQVALSAIKQQYDFESKEAEIELLTKDKQLAEAKLDNRNLIIYAMVAQLAVVAGFAFSKLRSPRRQTVSD